MSASKQPLTNNEAAEILARRRASREQYYRLKFAEMATPGHEVEFDPPEAQNAGIFTEDAMSEADARASVIDSPTLIPFVTGGNHE